MVVWEFDLVALIVGFLVGVIVGLLIFCVIIFYGDNGAWSIGFYEGWREAKNDKKEEMKSSVTTWSSVNGTSSVATGKSSCDGGTTYTDISGGQK